MLSLMPNALRYTRRIGADGVSCSGRPRLTVRRRHGPFIILLTANTISYLGSVLTIVALPWFVLATTGSAARTGLTGAVEVVALVLAGIFGGTIVDRAGFKRTSVVCDLLSALPLALIPAFYHTIGLSFGNLLVLVFLAGVFNQPGGTARESLLPALADRAELPLENANASYHAIPRFAQLVGPALAGVLIALLGASNVLLFDAATFVASAALVGVGISTVEQPSSAPARSLNSALHVYSRDLRDGLKLLSTDRLLTHMTLNNAAGNLLGAAMAGVVLPVYATDVVNSPVALGVMTSGFGAGALAGVALFGAVGPRVSRRAVYLGCWSLAGLAQLPMIAVPNLIVMTIILAVLGLGSGPNLPLTFTIAQERVPIEKRGRFFGLRSALSNAASPLGLVTAGYVLDATCLRTTIVALACGSVLLVGNVLGNPAFADLNAPDQ